MQKIEQLLQKRDTIFGISPRY